MRAPHSIHPGIYLRICFSAFLLLMTGRVLAGTPPDQFPPGHCMVVGRIQKRLPTVVITHGWRYKNFDYTTPPIELLNLGREINARLVKEFPSSSAGKQRVNIICYLWPEASRPLHNGTMRIWTLTNKCRNIGKTGEVEGEILASQLKAILGKRYRHPVHFIGHSFGAVVNAYAIHCLANESQWHSDIQFTVLDSALGLTRLSTKGFRKLLPDDGPARVLWVDNYMGIPLVAVGTEISGAGPASIFGGGIRVARSHSGVIEFYRETVNNPGNHNGFYYSVLLKEHGGWNFKTPVLWQR